MAFTGLFVIALRVVPLFVSPTSTPTQMPISTNTFVSKQPFTETLAAPTEETNLAGISTVVATDTPAPTFTVTKTSTSQLYPDLTVTGISDPICRPDYAGTILEFTIFVRNIGRVPTRSFGPFDVGVNLILGQRHYSLDEWATQFNGVIGTSNMQVSNLNPNQDIKFTVVIDIKGAKNFGIEVVANSGTDAISESDTANNTLLKYFSIYCY